MRTHRRASGRRCAQALVEFALVLPLFLLLLLGVIDFSRLLFTYISLANGARELAHVAALPRSSSTASIAAFNNYTLVAGSTNPVTDQIVVTVADQSCIRNQGLGQACLSSSLSTVTCSLPLQPTCVLPARLAASDGYVQVALTYTFVFNPLLNGVLSAAANAGMAPVPVLTTTTRAYIE
jgi:Flp pilus assembly protein TadG